MLMILQLSIAVDQVKADDDPDITFIYEPIPCNITIASVAPSDVLWSDIEFSGQCNTSNLGTYVTAGDVIFNCYGSIEITYLPTGTLLGSYTFFDFPSIAYTWNDDTNIITLVSVSPEYVRWDKFEFVGNCNTSGLDDFVTAGDQITNCYGTISLTYIPTNTLFGTWDFSPHPSITFVTADFANTFTITSVDPDDVLWSDIEVSGVCDTSSLGTYVTAGNTIFGCYGVISLTYLPTGTVLGSWSFSPGPDISFLMDDGDNTLTVTSVGVPDVFWSDIAISGNCDASGLVSYITPGDQITDCYGTISLTFSPTNTLLGVWEFSAQPIDGYIWGQVFGITDDGSNYLLEDALVIVKTSDGQFVASEYTDSDGRYFFSPVEAGTYSVEATKEGYIGAVNLNVVVESGAGTRVNLDLPQIPGGPGWIYGTVLGTNDNGTFPLEDALITVKTSDGQFVDSVYTYPTGFYPIFGIEAGTYSVEASKDGYLTMGKMEVIVEAGIGTEVDFNLFESGFQWAGWIYGTVLGTNDNGTFPMEDALVSVILNDDTVASAYTNQDGNYNVSVEPGTYSVEASKDGYWTMGKMVVVVEEGKGTQVDFNLHESIWQELELGFIYGTVFEKKTDGSIVPLADATVLYRQFGNEIQDAYQLWRVEFTDENGNFSIQLLPGSYELKADWKWLHSPTEIIEVEANQKIKLDFVLDVETTFEVLPRPDEANDNEDILRAIKIGNVGGEISIWHENNRYEHEILLYNNVTISELFIEKGRVSFKVSGDENSTGKTIAINVDLSTFNPNLGILVEYDGESVMMADDIDDILNPNNDGSHPEYLIVIGSNGAQLLVSIPHFSEHLITFLNLSPEEIAQFIEYAVIAAFVLIIIAAVVMFRKGKED